MNATTELERDVNEEALVAQRSNTTLFLSRRRELRLVREPRYPILASGSGRQAGETQGQVVNFTEGQFVCAAEGTVVLEDGRDADAAEILAWLESHRLNGDVNGGFWRIDPEAPPVSMEEIDALVQAAEKGDAETLDRILRQEREGWQREQILRVAEGSLDRVNRMSELIEREEQAQADAAAKRVELEQRERDLADREQALANAEKVAAAPNPESIQPQENQD